MRRLLNIDQYYRANLVGIIASTLCLIHCLLTPVIFIAQAGLAHHEHEHGHAHGPEWWGLIDVFFLVISFIAVYRSSLLNTKVWVSYALWFSWIALAFIIFNEKLGFLHLPELLILIPTISLIGLHIYSQKYCDCDEDCIHP